jgi:antitoxin component YwqK of YwqJK toxin-antitoxin module
MKKLILIISFMLATLYCSAQNVRKYYHDNGKLREINTYNDSLKLDGVCKSWNTDGKLIAKAYYFNGSKTGTWKVWHDNGQLAYVMKYRNNKKVGKCLMYDKNGVLVASHKY